MTTMITKRMLRGACEKQRDIFRKEWPKGAEATLENVLRGVELGLDLDWGTRWFTPEALEEYERQRLAAWKEWVVKHSAIWGKYGRTRRWDYYGLTQTWGKYERERKEIRAEFQRQHAAIWLEAFMASNRRET